MNNNNQQKKKKSFYPFFLFFFQKQKKKKKKMRIGIPTVVLCVCCLGGTFGFVYGMLWAYRDLTVCDGGNGLSQRHCWDEFNEMPLLLPTDQKGQISGGVDMEEDYAIMDNITVYALGDGCTPRINLVSQSRTRGGELSAFGQCHPFANLLTGKDPHMLLQTNSCRFTFTSDRNDIGLHDIGSHRTIIFRNVGKCPATIYYVRERFVKFNFVEYADRALIVGALCGGFYVFLLCWFVCMKIARDIDSTPSWQRERTKNRNNNNNLSQNIAMNEFNSI